MILIVPRGIILPCSLLLIMCGGSFLQIYQWNKYSLFWLGYLLVSETGYQSELRCIYNISTQSILAQRGGLLNVFSELGFPCKWDHVHKISTSRPVFSGSWFENEPLIPDLKLFLVFHGAYSPVLRIFFDFLNLQLWSFLRKLEPGPF